jgi:alpha-methylacyl-CoA racemase
MLLADLGARVIVLERMGEMAASSPPHLDPRRRGQESIRIDLKHPRAITVMEPLLTEADVLIEGMRPGVAERLGIGPDDCQRLNPRLVYARMTGWGQDGELAQRAGHDLNYIALTGALRAIGAPTQPPPPPLNLLGDYGGGGTYLVLGVLAALIERERSGLGNVIDASILDGVASLTAAVFGGLAAGTWRERGQNVFDGGAPFYRAYVTSDGEYVAVGAIEPAFYAALMRGVGLDAGAWPQDDQRRWPQLADELARRFAAHTRSHWAKVFEATDACVAPVLSFLEAPAHPHNRARGTYVDVAGITQPAPAPRFSRTPLPAPRQSPARGEHTDSVLTELGFGCEAIARLRAEGAVA